MEQINWGGSVMCVVDMEIEIFFFSSYILFKCNYAYFKKIKPKNKRRQISGGDLFSYKYISNCEGLLLSRYFIPYEDIICTKFK